MNDASEREQLRRLQVRLTRQLVLGDRGEASPGSIAESSEYSLRLPLDRGALNRAAECLIRKRLSQTAYLLRKSRRLLGKSYEAEFRRFAFEHHLSGHQAIARDAIAFARWEGSRCQCGESTVQRDIPILLDALRLEGSECEWGIRTVYLRVVRLRYDIPGWNGSGVGSAIVKRPRWVLLWRLAGRGQILVR
jgi:hypothetical protein